MVTHTITKKGETCQCPVHAWRKSRSRGHFAHQQHEMKWQGPQVDDVVVHLHSRAKPENVTPALSSYGRLVLATESSMTPTRMSLLISDDLWDKQQQQLLSTTKTIKAHFPAWQRSLCAWTRGAQRIQWYQIWLSDVQRIYEGHKHGKIFRPTL